MTFNKIIFLFTGLIFLNSWPVLGQKNDLLRIEIDAKTYDFIYFIPIKSNRLITIQHIQHAETSDNQWEINQFNSNLNRKFHENFITKSGFILLEYFEDQDSNIYAFFGNQSSSSRFEVIQYNYISDKLVKSETINDQRINYEHFDVLNGNQFISGIKSPSLGANIGQFFYTLTLVPIFNGSKVYSVNPALLVRSKNATPKNIIFDLKGESEILSTRSNIKSNSYAIVIRNLNKRKTTLHYYELDESGNLIIHTQLNSLNKKNLLTGQLVPFDSSFSFIGTYNNEFNKNSNKNSSALGMFISNLKNGIETTVNFHPFSEFKNAQMALDFRNRKKLEEHRRKGDTLDFGFKLLVHQNILQYDSSYVVLAERYYPEYHYETFHNMYGSMYSEQIFDGYRFSHAIVAGFSSQGDLLWDNILNISNVISYNLDENVIVHFDGTTQVLIYYVEGKIYSTVLNGNEILFKKEEAEVPTVGINERIVYESYGKIYHWYGPYFLLTGYQIVMDDRANRRKVFFVIKLKFS